MRNLQNLKHDKLDFEDEPAPLTASTWDPSDDSLILAFGPTEHDPAITLRRLAKDTADSSLSALVASWDAVSPQNSSELERILDLHCFPDSKSLTLILAGGDIVVVREEAQPGEDGIEIIGSVDEGITAAAWSPDEEILTVASAAGTLLFMTRDFESIANVSLSPDDLTVSNHVSVGWGKKETQFKGRGAAKALRDPTVPEHVDEGTLSPLDDGRVCISWRGDGQYLGINSIMDTEPKRRVIRVFSREGVLDSVSEPINGLEAALSWKPSGQLVASVQRRGDDVDVIFFERNGLRHGEFSLRGNDQSTLDARSYIDLAWNMDSSVLAITMKDRVQLWTMGNYHYYLKQEIKLDEVGGTHARTAWHPEKALHLCAMRGSSLRRLAYRFEVCRGSVTPPHDLGIVAVIDGSKLKITPMRTANVPPPMAFDEIELSGNALDVAISDDGKEIAVLQDDQVALLFCDYGSKPLVKVALRDTLPLGKHDGVSTATVSQVRQLYRRTDHDKIFFDNQGHSSSDPDSPSIQVKNPITETWHSASDTQVNFSLSDSGMLNIQGNDQTLRIPSCTSYILTNWHCIFTTGQHLLKFIHLHDGTLEIPPDEPEKDERCRSIERGAIIVTVMPSAYSLVLQMPRGNLETIYPRALVLAGIRRSIGERDYKKAFLTCRTHRVDMNILFDYAPQQFMRDIEFFIKQVKKVEYIDLLLSSLSEEDVSKTLYRETLAPAEKPPVNGLANGDATHAFLGTESKVNKICDAFLQALQKHSSTRLQNISTAHVSKNPPDLDAGLRLISALRKKGDQEGLEHAVDHICFLADVNQLYDTALGLYDLDVALLVAQQSQKDPREYLPYLQSLQDMQPLRQRFTIDNDLKRYNKALGHLHSMEAFDELKSYMSRHDLYSAAIELYRYDNGRLAELMRLHADYLSSRNRYKEAGIAYEYISDHASAYEAYRAISMWQECLTNAALVPLQGSELSTIAEDLANSLQEANDYASAARIHLDYLEDLAGAALLLCKGYQFAEATRLVSSRQKPELLRTVIDPGLIEASASMTEMLAEMKTQLGAQVPRLRELREKKAEDPMAFLDGMEGGDGDVPDNISLAPTDASTSGGTFMTRYTNRSTGTLATNATRKTSKNRRREERKRARGKKGTVYEEEYLINSIARLIERLNSIGEDAAKLVEGLMRRAMRERAVAVQMAMDEVVEACTSCMSEVFTVEKSQQAGVTEEQTASRPWGGEGVLWEAMASRTEAPVLRKFERLGLIS